MKSRKLLPNQNMSNKEELHKGNVGLNKMLQSQMDKTNASIVESDTSLVSKIVPSTSHSDHFRRYIYSAPPKRLPELFLYIMDTQDSFLVSVPARMVAF